MKTLQIAISFLTTLPPKYKGEWDEKAFSQATIFYPLVGLFIGVVVAAVLWLFSHAYPLFAAFAGLLTAILLTGGLHLDGYMDMCDGILASRGPERAMEIMKDSRVGSFAVIGVVLLLLGKFTLYVWLLDTEFLISAILAAFAFSRFMMLYAIVSYPSARKTGLGYTVQQYVSKPALLWSLLLIVVLLVASRALLLIPALILSFFIMVVISGKISLYLGGLTGDIYGAVAEIGEFVFLVSLLLCSSFFGNYIFSPLF